jgi:hypothetical protein
MLELILDPPASLTEEPFVIEHANDQSSCRAFNRTVTIDIQTDLYPAEVSWELVTQKGSIVADWKSARYDDGVDSPGLSAAG